MSGFRHFSRVRFSPVPVSVPRCGFSLDLGPLQSSLYVFNGFRSDSLCRARLFVQLFCKWTRDVYLIESDFFPDTRAKASTRFFRGNLTFIRARFV